MRCFNHNEKEAIGTCKACSKGICIECATDLGHGLACKGVHEEAIEKVNNIIEKNAKYTHPHLKIRLSRQHCIFLWGCCLHILAIHLVKEF